MSSVRERVFAWVGVAVAVLAAVSLTVAVFVQQIIADRNATNSPATTSAILLQGTQLANFTPVSDVPELKIADTKAGSGDEVKAGATVVVDYTGAVAATGTIFQSSLDSGQPATLSLNQVIEGWKKGIVGMKVGGQRRLLIPAAEAYGANPPAGSGIPANAPLVFDITLHAIQ